MRERDIPNAALAVSRAGRLVLARGYGAETPPTSLFRIASLTKPITATAILRLVQDGRLRLSDRVDGEISVRHLLQHLGGWDRNLSGDPMFSDAAISRRLGVALPVSRRDIIDYVTGLPLDHRPGTTFAYSNYGYLLLGRVIERVAGMSYGDYVRDAILDPLGLAMRLGRTATRADGEVSYRSSRRGVTVLDGSCALVPEPYGAFNLENMDSHGGWLASAVDLVRFAAVFDGSTSVLSAESIAEAFAVPETGVNEDGWYYGCGWQVRPVPGGLNTWHTGRLAGSYALLVRRFDGLCWAALFNGDGDDDIDPLLHGAADLALRALV